MRILILLTTLFISALGYSQERGFVLRGDTLYHCDGLGGCKQLTKLVPVMESGKVLSNNGTSYIWADAPTSQIGYTISVQALTSSPGDGQTVYFGMLPKAPITTAAVSKVHIRKAGTIKAANIYCYSGTAGTAESWSLYVRVNNTTDYLIKTVSSATSERIFSNTSLSISVSVGDYIEIKGIQPTWATNPLTTIYGGYIYIE